MLSDHTKDLHSVSERFRNFQKLQDSSFHGVMRRWRVDKEGLGWGGRGRQWCYGKTVWTNLISVGKTAFTKGFQTDRQVL